MTAPAFTPAIDPTGFGGERIARLSAEGEPTIVEVWLYPATRDLEALADAWHREHATAERMPGMGARYVRVTRPA